MLELCSIQRKNAGLIAGTLEMGYYGLIPSSEFIDGVSLADAVNLTLGTHLPAHNALGWFKFAYKNKTLYIPKRSLKTNVSWTDLYNTGLIYGSDSVGEYTSTTPVIQNKTVMINGKNYRVRALRFSPENPSISDEVKPGSELRDLLLKLCAHANNPAWTPSWGTYTIDDMGLIGSNNGPFTISLETNSANINQHWLVNVSYFKNLFPYVKTTRTVNGGWRPVLELIS